MRTRRDFLKHIGLAFGALSLSPSLGSRVLGAVPLRRRPALQRLCGRNGTIIWTTLEPGRAALEWSGPSSTQIVSAATTIFEPVKTGFDLPYYQHQADFEGLIPGAEHSYRILMDGVDAMPAHDLRFKAPGPGNFRFLAFGDSGWGGPSQAQIAGLIGNEHPDLVLVTGDLAYPMGTYESYETRYFDYYANSLKRVPFFPCPGNHDYYADGLESYLAMNTLPDAGAPEEDRGRYYSFDRGNTHFVALDSMGSLLQAVENGGRMLEWLEQDLAMTRKFWRIAFFHHPPYAAGPNENDPMCFLARQYIVPILERYGVQLVMSGHEHSYQRTEPIFRGYNAAPGDGIVYLTSGGGGAVLYPVFPSNRIAAGAAAHHYLRIDSEGFHMTGRAIGEDGREIDRFTLAPPPRLSSHSVIENRLKLIGTHLASVDRLVQGRALPTEIAGTSVLLGGEALPLYYVSSTEIVAHLPPAYSLDGRISAVTPNGIAELSLTNAPVVPDHSLVDEFGL